MLNTETHQDDKKAVDALMTEQNDLRRDSYNEEIFLKLLDFC